MSEQNIYITKAMVETTVKCVADSNEMNIENKACSEKENPPVEAEHLDGTSHNKDSLSTSASGEEVTELYANDHKRVEDCNMDKEISDKATDDHDEEMSITESIEHKQSNSVDNAISDKITDDHDEEMSNMESIEHKKSDNMDKEISDKARDDHDEEMSITESIEHKQSNSVDNAISDKITDDEEELSITTTKKKRISKLIDTDSSESDHNNGSDAEEQVSNIKVNKKNKSHIIASDGSESDEKHVEEGKIFKKVSTLIDTDSSASDVENEVSNLKAQINKKNVEDTGENMQHKLQKKKTAKQRKNQKAKSVTTKEKTDNMITLQSEQQRLHREAYISIPYHKPVKRTLQDFLERRNTEKTAQLGSHVVKAKSARMTAEELEEYAKYMEERAEEAKEFFKSDDESEGEQENEVEGVEEEKQEKEEEAAEFENKSLVEAVENEQSDKPSANEDLNATEIVETNVSEEKSVESELKDFAIITAVEGLPPLDLNDFHVNVDANLKKTQSIYNVIKSRNITNNPSLKGGPGTLIDFDTTEVIQKSSGVDNLIARFMSTRKTASKHGTVTMDTVATETCELQKESNETQKPGAAFLKLKQHLKSVMQKKRLEELHKKFQQQDNENEAKSTDVNDKNDFNEEELDKV